MAREPLPKQPRQNPAEVSEDPHSDKEASASPPLRVISGPPPSFFQREAPAIESLLTTEEAAACLGTTKRTLEAWRYAGGGPVFVKLGGRLVRYRPRDLENFVAAGERLNTGGAAP
ncbi:MAG: helix-turn-helix domain-containing protein [Sphingomonadaceae bacterium]